MKRALAFASRLCDALANAGVTLDPAAVLDRGDALALSQPGLWSANRSCRLVAAANGWLAVNLARDDDRDLVPAWLERAIDCDPWQAVVEVAPCHDAAELCTRAGLLGLPVSLVGEARLRLPERMTIRQPPPRGLCVVDLSSLWAGPLCASVLALAGADVVKVESRSRPDTTAISASALDRRLNGAKRRVVLDFADRGDRATLATMIARADIVVTSARARAFVGLGLDPATILATNPKLVWIGITGHGWDSDRVAFGDDAAAAGGLVRHSANGAPQFVGDALADPLTGLAAAVAALSAVEHGEAAFIDLGMANVAAAAAGSHQSAKLP